MSYVCLLAIVVFSAMQSVFTKISKTENVIVFNIFKVMSAFVTMAIPSLITGIALHMETLFLSFLYGAFLALSMYSGYKALQSGVMSLTSMIVSFSVIMPVLYGILFCKEAVNIIKISGFILMALSMVLVNLGSSDKNSGNNKKWIKYISFTFIANGLCSVLQKEHQSLYPGKYKTEFNFFSMLICGCIFLIIYIANNKNKVALSGKDKICAVWAGFFNSLAGYFTLMLSGYEDASVAFPMISIGTIFTTAILGNLLFKEKLEKKFIIALFCGLAAIVMLKI